MSKMHTRSAAVDAPSATSSTAIEKASTPLYRRAHPHAERALDLLIAVPALILLLPLLLLIALAIRIDSPGPALFWQRRGGYRGRPFRLVKFRTMVADAEQQVTALSVHSLDPNWLLLERDPRITRLGRLLRHTSVDELPQLWNVIRGEMSIVGPRPLPLAEEAKVPRWASARREVRPGITGSWQVSGRLTLSFEEMLQLDCVYARHHSLRGDIWLLLCTIPAALTRRGVN